MHSCFMSIRRLMNVRRLAPANGQQLKIWQCYDNLPAQTWFYTADQRIAVVNSGMQRLLPASYRQLYSRAFHRPVLGRRQGQPE